MNTPTYKEQQKAKLMFRDWWDNFLTVDRFAEYYGVSTAEALEIIKLGRIIHNNEAKFLKEATNGT